MIVKNSSRDCQVSFFSLPRRIVEFLPYLCFSAVAGYVILFKFFFSVGVVGREGSRQCLQETLDEAYKLEKDFYQSVLVGMSLIGRS